MDDDDLVARSLDEPGVFEELVSLHGARIHAYLYRRASRDADDLLCEVWLAAFEGRHRYDPSKGEVAAWLFGIARNVLLASLRGRRRTEIVATVEDTHDDQWAAVDRRLDAAGLAPAVRAAVAALSPEEREVLLLVAWEQLSPTETAAVLGIPPGTARSRLHRARSRITESWPAPEPTEAFR